MNNKNYKEFINQDYNSFSKWLFSLSGYEFAFLSSATGFLIAPNLTVNQQNSLGNFFILLGEVLITINAQDITNLQYPETKSNFKPELQTNSTEEEILLIKKELYKVINESFGNKKL